MQHTSCLSHCSGICSKDSVQNLYRCKKKKKASPIAPVRKRKFKTADGRRHLPILFVGIFFIFLFFVCLIKQILFVGLFLFCFFFV